MCANEKGVPDPATPSLATTTVHLHDKMDPLPASGNSLLAKNQPVHAVERYRHPRLRPTGTLQQM
jgi:hypothetical protein